MTKQPRPRPLVRFVYVIGPQAGLQKVGIAVDPQVRLAALQTASPLALQIHAAVPVPFSHAHTIERAVHKALAGCCARSEWFDTTPAAAIAAVHTASAPFIGQVTAAPDPKVIWPAVANWRMEPGRGLPLFDYSRGTEAVERSSWWAKLRRSLRA